MSLTIWFFFSFCSFLCMSYFVAYVVIFTTCSSLPLKIVGRNNFVPKIRNNGVLKNFCFCQAFRPLPFYNPPKPFLLCKTFWNSTIYIWTCGKDVGLFLVCADLKDTVFKILAEIWTIYSFLRFPSFGRS